MMVLRSYLLPAAFILVVSGCASNEIRHYQGPGFFVAVASDDRDIYLDIVETATRTRPTTLQSGNTELMFDLLGQRFYLNREADQWIMKTGDSTRTVSIPAEVAERPPILLFSASMSYLICVVHDLRSASTASGRNGFASVIQRLQDGGDFPFRMWDKDGFFVTGILRVQSKH